MSKNRDTLQKLIPANVRVQTITLDVDNKSANIKGRVWVESNIGKVSTGVYGTEFNVVYRLDDSDIQPVFDAIHDLLFGESS